MDNLQTTDPHAVRKPRFSFESKNVIIFVLSVALLTTTLSATYFFLKNKNLNIQQNTSSNPLPTPQLTALPENKEVDDVINCTETECLIAQGNSHYGYSTISGYYKRYEGTQWEWFNEEVFCDGLVTTGGSTTIIQEFRDTAERGNTLNKIIDGELVVNINLSSLTEAEKNRILNSSIDNPVEIGFAKRVPRGTGVSTCFSVIDIFSVE